MLSKFLIKKIAPLLLFFFLFSVLFSRPVQAFYTPTSTYPFQFEQAVYKTPSEMNLQSFIFESFKATGWSFVATIYGFMSSEEKEGLLADVGRLTAAVYTSPPASGVKYFADIGSQLGVVSPAFAQERGVGFEIMAPLLPVWKAFRNLSYLFFVLIFVGLGFAIMFRVKISPQAVITIQSALPRIVLALILITFSYAIVGFLFDLLAVLFFLIVNTFRELLIDGIAGFVPGGGAFRAALEALVGLIIPKVPGTVGMAMQTLGTIIFFNFGTQIATFFIMMSLGPIGLLLGIIIAILAVIIALRILWAVLKAYAMIVVNLIFAPFVILVGTLPGGGAIGAWFRSLVANIAVFPTILIMLLLSQYLLIMGVAMYLAKVVEEGLPLIEKFINAIIGNITVWAFIQALLLKLISPINIGQTLSIMLLPIIGFVILLLAPNAANMIQSFIRGRPFEYGAAIGAPIGAAVGVITAPVRTIVTPISGEAAKAWGEAAGRKIPGIKRVYEWGASRSERTGERG